MNIIKYVGITLLIFIGIFVFSLTHTQAEYGFENITGLWLFDNGEGTVAADSTGNGNDGTIHGASWVDGKFGKALQFDGTDDWVEVAHSNTVAFEAGTSFSVTLHFKGTKVGGSLAGKNYEDTSQATPWYLLWNGGGDNKVTFFLRDSANTSFRPQSTTEIGDDQWHFIAGVADTDSGKASIWIDGTMEAELDFNTDDGYGTAEGVFHIGRHFDRYTAGIIDEVALYNVALSEADLNGIMNDGLVSVTDVEPKGKLTTTWGTIKHRVSQ